MYIKLDKVRIKRIALDLLDDYPFNSRFVTFYVHSVVTSITFSFIRFVKFNVCAVYVQCCAHAVFEFTSYRNDVCGVMH